MYINKDDPQFQKLIKMTDEEFDKYMCETYPIMFQERNKSIQESCMAWGFNIGKGWYYILDNACQKLQAIWNKTNIQVVFTQIKEKFGTARFYYTIDANQAITFVVNGGIGQTIPMSQEQQKIWCNIIDDIVSDAENTTVHTCSECGEHHYEEKPTTGYWIHDTCNKCFLKAKPDYKEQFEKNQKLNAFKEDIGYILRKLTPEEYAALEKLIQDVQDRIEDDSNKN